MVVIDAALSEQIKVIEDLLPAIIEHAVLHKVAALYYGFLWEMQADNGRINSCIFLYLASVQDEAISRHE